MRYLVMIRKTDTGYSADAPDVPGCIAAAGRLFQVRKLMAEALALHFDLLRQSGETIPKPRKSIEFAIDDDTEEEFCSWVEVELPEPVGKKKGRRKQSA